MNNTLTDIESALVTGLRPSFLAIGFEDEFIHIIVSHPSFEHKSISKRIRICYDLIRSYNRQLLKDNSIIIETYDSHQLTDLLEDSFL